MKPIFQNKFTPFLLSTCRSFLLLHAEKWAPHSWPKSEWVQGGYDPWLFELDHLLSMKPTVAKKIHFFTGPRAVSPFSCMQVKGYTIKDSKSEWNQWSYDPRAFKLGHFLSMKPIFSKNIFTLLQATCIISLSLHAWKRAHHYGVQKGMTNWGVYLWGIQIGQFGVQNLLFIQNIFPLCSWTEMQLPSWRTSWRLSDACLRSQVLFSLEKRVEDPSIRVRSWWSLPPHEVCAQVAQLQLRAWLADWWRSFICIWSWHEWVILSSTVASLAFGSERNECSL